MGCPDDTPNSDKLTRPESLLRTCIIDRMNSGLLSMAWAMGFCAARVVGCQNASRRRTVPAPRGTSSHGAPQPGAAGALGTAYLHHVPHHLSLLLRRQPAQAHLGEGSAHGAVGGRHRRRRLARGYAPALGRRCCRGAAGGRGCESVAAAMPACKRQQKWSAASAPVAACHCGLHLGGAALPAGALALTRCTTWSLSRP